MARKDGFGAKSARFHDKGLTLPRGALARGSFTGAAKQAVLLTAYLWPGLAPLWGRSARGLYVGAGLVVLA